MVFVNAKTTCANGFIVVISATPGSGSASIVVYNAGSNACTGVYILSFVVVN
jgi:hypothetical protein